MVDDSFVPSSKQPSVIYCRLTDFKSFKQLPKKMFTSFSSEKERTSQLFYSQSKMTGCTHICKANSFDVCPRKWHDDIKFSFILATLRILMIGLTNMLHPNCIILDNVEEPIRNILWPEGMIKTHYCNQDFFYQLANGVYLSKL